MTTGRIKLPVVANNNPWWRHNVSDVYMINVNCQCGSHFRLEDRWAGKQARCPVCQNVVRVPAATTAPSSPVLATPSRPQEQEPDPSPRDAVLAPAPAQAATQPVRSQPAAASSMTPPTPSLLAPAPAQPAPAQPAPAQPAPRQPGSATARQTVAEPFDETNSGAWIRPAMIASISVAVVVLSGLAMLVFFTSGEPQEVVETNDRRQTTRDDRDVTTQPGTATSSSNNTAVDSATRPAADLEPRDTERIQTQPTQSNAETPPVSPPQNTNDPAGEESPVDPAARPNSLDSEPVPTEPLAEITVDPGPSRSTNPPPKQGLSGVSRQYDDFHCQRIQQQFGWRVPKAAEFLEVDGERLLISNLAELRQASAPYLFLPQGRHAIRLRSGEQPLRTEVDTHFSTAYGKIQTFFRGGTDIRTNDLLTRGAWAMDVHNTPFLLNLTGASYAASGKWGAAERNSGVPW